MKTLSIITFASLVSLGLLSCTDNTNQADTQTSSDEKTLRITPVGQSPEFPDAQLTIDDIKTEVDGKNVNITFNYGVQNYELKTQTEDAAGKGCNNSKDGQHIHFILNNTPYVALYEPTHTFTVPVNSENYVMSFLSRSYHESVKAENAGVLIHFKVDEQGNITQLDIPEHPMVFASRPKGDYLGEDTEKVLFDFYVYNANLGNNALVKATINNNEFTIDKWEAYFIEDAEMGDLDINIELTDIDGNAISGEHTSVSHSARLAQQEPMQ